MFRDIKFALRSLGRAKGLALTVIVTLALGIGANAAIFSLVRGVLLRPLANRDEGSLVYIRQKAPGIGSENTTFSVPEIQDIRGRTKAFTSLGEFSTIGFTMVGLGEPRVIRAGVVNGNYFEVMGLRAAAGRLLGPQDDGADKPGAAVLTYRFWTTLQKDPAVLGKTIRLGVRNATIVGVLEPSDPYPAETEIIANMVTSPHHLSATMVTGREHRMTEIFGRLAPNTSVESARTELNGIHGSIIKEHPEAYAAKANFQLEAMPLRQQITSRAQTVLLVLLAASVLVFIIACSNVANLFLARTVRRESELAVRAALGASTVALRRTLVAESLLLSGTGAALGLAIAPLMFSQLVKYASRFSVRALDLTLDSSPLLIGTVLALAASVLLAFVPRLPSSDATHGFGLGGSGLRITGATNRRLRIFAMVQIAASFILLSGAGMLLKTLITLQSAERGFQTTNVLAVNIPVVSFNRKPEQIRDFYRQLQAEVLTMPGVQFAAMGSTVPWRDPGFGQGLAFAAEGKRNANPQDDPHAKSRTASPGFFATLDIPIIAGRDFNDGDRLGSELVVIINKKLANELFPGQDPLNHHLQWTDGLMKFIGTSTDPRRIVGVVGDIDDEHIEAAPSMTVYQPFEQELGSRLFVRAQGDPHALVPQIAKVAHSLSTDQPVERAATLEEVRAEVLAPQRLNTIVFGGFAALALAISIVGVAGVLAFSVSARTREFGVRLAIGSQPGALLSGVLKEGVIMAGSGVAAGGLGGYGLAKVIGSFIPGIELPSMLPIVGAAAVLIAAATMASFLPAMRAARVDVIEALRSE